jgi:tRNA 2-selenouridine synthase
LRGKAQVEAWQAQVRGGDTESVVRELLLKHYDPGYAGSTSRNFAAFADAPVIAPRDRSHAAMAELAGTLANS